MQASAKASPPIAPQICNGAFPTAAGVTFGSKDMFLCPAGYAAYGARFGAGSSISSGENVAVYVDCCPLPASDILLDEHVVSFEQCPEGHVVTGGVPETLCKSCRKTLRCTKVNLARYRLEGPEPGTFWGFGSPYWQEKRHMLRGHLPAAVRYGLGRADRVYWFPRGCTGSPVGSLLTGKSAKWCFGLSFRRLTFAGVNGDPKAGTAVPMYPDCDDLSDIFAPSPRCERIGPHDVVVSPLFKVPPPKSHLGSTSWASAGNGP
jgi:hypothetical protein